MANEFKTNAIITLRAISQCQISVPKFGCVGCLVGVAVLVPKRFIKNGIFSRFLENLFYLGQDRTNSTEMPVNLLFRRLLFCPPFLFKRSGTICNYFKVKVHFW